MIPSVVDPRCAILKVVSIALALSSTTLALKPFVPGEILVTHGASNIPANSPVTGLAPGSLFGMNLRGLAFTDELQPGEKITLRFRMASSTSSEELPLFFTEIDAYFESIVPATAVPGRAEVIVVAGRRMLTARIYIAPFNFGFFTKSADGFGSAVAQNITGSGPEPNLMTRPIGPGSDLTLWGTGLGRNPSDVIVEIAGVSVSPSYAGPAPGFPGVDQINVRIPPEPSGIPDGCYVPIRLKMGPQSSPFTTIAKSAAPGPCPHPLGISPEKLETLDRGDSLPVGQVDLISMIEPDSETPSELVRREGIAVHFYRFGAAGVESLTGALETAPLVSSCRADVRPEPFWYLILLTPSVDPGSAPVLTGPSGQALELSGNVAGHYSASTPVSGMAPLQLSYWKEGLWRLSFRGGRDTPAFDVPIRVPSQLHWLNRPANTISRTRDLPLQWNPTTYVEGERVEIKIEVLIPFPRADGTGRLVYSVSCVAPAHEGSLIIPATLLSTLPDPAASSPPTLSLSLINRLSPPVFFEAPLVGGGTLPGHIGVTFRDTANIRFE